MVRRGQMKEKEEGVVESNGIGDRAWKAGDECGCRYVSSGFV